MTHRVGGASMGFGRLEWIDSESGEVSRRWFGQGHPEKFLCELRLSIGSVLMYADWSRGS